MTKEEFIKLIESLDFEELCCATINYRKRKPSTYIDNGEDTEIKTLCLGENLYHEIEDLKCRCNSAFSEMKKDLLYYIDQEVK